MTIIIDGKERFYDDTIIKKFNKIYCRIKYWYIVFFMLCIMNLIIYVLKIHNNYGLIFSIPGVYWASSCIFLIILQLKSSKPDYDYLEEYYPEISNKIWIYGRDNGIMNNFNSGKFYRGDYIEKGIDPIIDIIRNKKTILPIFFIPFFQLLILGIIAEFFRR